MFIVPSWPAPERVHALCSTREGGVSLAPYASLNLGDHVGDRPAAVASNRASFAAACAAHPVFLSQVHGKDVVQLERSTENGHKGDACVTSAPDLACTIMVADCLPLLICDQGGAKVAAAHAGWRGLADGVIEATCAHFNPVDTMVWLGPCIGPEAFEVGPEVKAAFEAHDVQAGAMFKAHAPGKWLADLPGLARLRLRALGVTQVYGNDGSTDWCTVSNPSKFFSHRRDGVSGRFAASIWLT